MWALFFGLYISRTALLIETKLGSIVPGHERKLFCPFAKNFKKFPIELTLQLSSSVILLEGNQILHGESRYVWSFNCWLRICESLPNEDQRVQMPIMDQNALF